MKLHEIQQALEALGIYKKLDEIRVSAQKKVIQAGGMIYQSFISMIDTPSSYQGNAGKVVKVRSDETGLEFSSNSGTDWGEIGGTLSNQTDLQTALNGKANAIHTHVEADITDLDKYTKSEVDTKLEEAKRYTFLMT